MFCFDNTLDLPTEHMQVHRAHRMFVKLSRMFGLSCSNTTKAGNETTLEVDYLPNFCVFRRVFHKQSHG